VTKREIIALFRFRADVSTEETREALEWIKSTADRSLGCQIDLYDVEQGDTYLTRFTHKVVLRVPQETTVVDLPDLHQVMRQIGPVLDNYVVAHLDESE